MFSNVQFLTTEENSFAAVTQKIQKKQKQQQQQQKNKKTKKTTENKFVPANTLFYTQRLNSPPNSHLPILSIKL